MKASSKFTQEQIKILLKIKKILGYSFPFFKNSSAESLDSLNEIFMILQKNSPDFQAVNKALEEYLTQKKLNLRSSVQSHNKTAVFANSIKTSIEQSIDEKEPYDINIVLHLLGGRDTGKTSIMNQFCKNNFPSQYKRTIAVDFGIKKIFPQNTERELWLTLWDISYNKTMSSTIEKYLRYSPIFFGIFDLTNQESLKVLQAWINYFTQIKQHTIHADGTQTLAEGETGINISQRNRSSAACNQLRHYPLMILGNKSDLKDKRAISQEEIDDFISRNKKLYPDIRYYEISAKDKTNLEEPFFHLISTILPKVFPEKSADTTVSIASDEGCSNHQNFNSNNNGFLDNYKKILLCKILKEIARLIEPEESTTTLRNAKALAFYQLYKIILEKPHNMMSNAINGWRNNSSDYQDSSGMTLTNQTLLKEHQHFWSSGETHSIEALNDIYHSVYNPR